MKILNAPPPVVEWRKRCTCQKCDTTVEVGASDLVRYDGGHNGYQAEPSQASFRCPTCKREVWIDRALIPENVWLALKPRSR